MTNSTFRGFARLQTPSDLFDKLEHDLTRLVASPLDVYAAFDFFCTAEHLGDWKFPGKANELKRKEFRKSTPLLRLVSHLANGSKHFIAEAKHHTSVKAVERESYVEAGYVEPDYVEDKTVIYLDEMKAEFGVDRIEVVELAKRTVDFWRNEFLGSSQTRLPRTD